MKVKALCWRSQLEVWSADALTACTKPSFASLMFNDRKIVQKGWSRLSMNHGCVSGVTCDKPVRVSSAFPFRIQLRLNRGGFSAYISTISVSFIFQVVLGSCTMSQQAINTVHSKSNFNAPWFGYLIPHVLWTLDQGVFQKTSLTNPHIYPELSLDSPKPLTRGTLVPETHQGVSSVNPEYVQFTHKTFWTETRIHDSPWNRRWEQERHSTSSFCLHELLVHIATSLVFVWSFFNLFIEQEIFIHWE